MRILMDQNIQRRQLNTFLQFYTASCQLFVILNDRDIFDYSIDYQMFKFNQQDTQCAKSNGVQYSKFSYKTRALPLFMLPRRSPDQL
jgi:hypothetical protein